MATPPGGTVSPAQDDDLPSIGDATSSGKRKKKTPQEIEEEVRATVAEVRRSSIFSSMKSIGSPLTNSERRGSNGGAQKIKRAILAPFAAKGDASLGKNAYATAAGLKSKSGKDDAGGKRSARQFSVVGFLDSKWIQFLIFLATLSALFAPDLFIIYGSIETDYVLDDLMFVTLLLFTIELALNSMYREGYILSFFFFLDVVALISLIPDISFIWDKIIGNDSAIASTDEQDNLAILRAGRLVRTGTRTSRALRLLRIVRFARLMRIFRLIRILRSHLTRRYLSSKGDAHTQAPNKLGLRLADLLGKRVILGTILLLLVLPYLEVSRVDSSAEYGLELLELSFEAGNEPLPVYNSLESAYIEQQKEYLVELIVKNETRFVNVDLSESARDDYLVYAITDANSVAVLDETLFEQAQAKLNIILTCVLTSLMALSSFFFNRDVHQNVVRPIRKTTMVVRKLARTLYLLSKEDDEKQDAADDESMLESHFIDTVMDQLITFFKVDAKEDEHPSGKAESADAKVHPSSSTQNRLLHQDSALDVREDPELRRAMGTIDDEQIDSLKSFENLFEDKQSLTFFKVFLTSEFAVESLLFVEQVDAYKARWGVINNMHESMVRRYIDEHGQFQVNINDSQRRRILKFDGLAYRLDLYDEARQEIYKQLERDNFPRFLKSSHAQNLRNFKKAAIARKKLEEDAALVGDEGPSVDPYKIVRIVKTFTSRLRRPGPKTSEPTSPKTAGAVDGALAEGGEEMNVGVVDGALTTRSEPAAKSGPSDSAP
ncbi:Regulator of G-protein signaling 13 [Hondaea fermentalgiana]|uniref:Regulator of G-protein signaling 13 n=1 Tax=Hondaea fermentalgiana TaxID=2315210 RepID=A0A2R5GD25_9STRA|nr:Regulator of G-protein signaling 13 [Hondaea fermentalgiana]|eukprot:GBG27618.1 Regulator of G-protein signaling 13 [Hondaea fermentalgiana]